MYETSFMFYIPKARGYDTHNLFCKYSIQWKFISDSIYNFINSQKRKKNTDLSSFITNFTAENV